MRLDTYDGTEAFARSARVHQLAGGRGCAELLSCDVSAPAILLERLGPNLDELEMDVPDVLETIATTLRAFWRPVSADIGLPTGADKAPWLAHHIETSGEEIGWPCDRDVIAQALALCEHEVWHFMARPLAEFRRRHPDVTFDYVSATPTPQCLDALRADDADLAFVTLTDDGVLEHRPAVRTPWVLVVPADRHLAAVSPVEPVAAYHRHAARHRLAGDGRTARIPAPVMTVASRRGRATGSKHLAQALSARPTAVSMSPSGAPVGSIRPALASSACTAAVASARTALALERARRSQSRTVVAGNRVQQRRPDR